VTEIHRLTTAFRDARGENQVRNTALALIDYLQEEIKKSNKAMEGVLPLLEELDRKMKEANDGTIHSGEPSPTSSTAVRECPEEAEDTEGPGQDWRTH
jgi:hypothetical protein